MDLLFSNLKHYSLQTTAIVWKPCMITCISLNTKEYGNNIDQGEVFHENIFWDFKCLETVTQLEMYIQ